MKIIPVAYLIFFSIFCNAQFSNRIWCFGDSAGIDFTNPQTPTPFSSVMDCRGSCCSIADSLNQLLFYAHTGNDSLGSMAGCWCAGQIMNKDHNKLIGGDSLIAEPWYDQMVIIPFPLDSSKFYLFTLDIATTPGLYYSVIDMSLDSGRGMVIQKNVLASNLPEYFSGIAAVKNGNGRDWWIIFRPSNFQLGGNATNEFYTLAITPQGVQSPQLQTIGSINSTNAGCIKFSHAGNKIAFVNFYGLIEIYNFDRCTGILSSFENIQPETLIQPYGNSFYAIGVEFSANDSVLYVSTDAQTSLLLQYDLNASNISSTEVVIAQIGNPIYPGGQICLAPDNKIYWTCAWNDGLNANWPYPSNAFDTTNMYLSVINNPNLLDTLCDFHAFSFYLGGKRTYYGLPNNPNYNMNAWGGSVCDTLGLPNGVGEIETHSSSINIFYHSEWQTAFINASGLSGKNYSLHIVALNGSEIYSENGFLASAYYTKDFGCDKLSSGTYLVLLETEKERLVKKFIVD